MTDYAGPERARFLRDCQGCGTPLMGLILIMAIDGVCWLAAGIAIGWWIWA